VPWFSNDHVLVKVGARHIQYLDLIAKLMCIIQFKCLSLTPVYFSAKEVRKLIDSQSLSSIRRHKKNKFLC
jgi:hypothetical protein